MCSLYKERQQAAVLKIPQAGSFPASLTMKEGAGERLVGGVKKDAANCLPGSR